MRTSASKAGLRVNAVAGTHVVLLGFDLQDPKDCLGFAIERRDHEAGEQYYLSGYKVFPYAQNLYPPGAPVSTREHPVQDFCWQDFTARPDRRYDYRVVPLHGAPKSLEEGKSVTVRVRTEKEWGKAHSVFFNRGIAGSQAYARKWGTDMPADIADPKVWEWLSRGLKEALLAFVGRAKSKRFGLRAAMYEFQDPDVLAAFRRAFTATGGDVRVVVDLRQGDGKPRKKNLAAIDDENLQSTMIVERTATKSAIAHNKFVVLLEDDEPVAVWTGSTNVTLGGLYAQSNVGHAVENGRLAGDFLEYWKLLAADPENADLRPQVEALSPDPDLEGEPTALRAVFSPRSSLGPLEQYAAAAGRAREGVFFTAAFGINPLFAAQFVKPHGHLVYAVLESLGTQESTIAISKNVIAAKNNFVAVGGGLPTDLEGGYARWLEELTKLRAVSNVDYIHDKFLLVDPLSDEPLVITGSANFSDASTRRNDENMLVIQGDRRVADIYLGEFLRLFKHYYFRDVMRRVKKTDPNAGLLAEQPEKWTAKHYRPGNRLTKARELFGADRGW
jgi:phosphatidylserine/phosphatidylglycerophosphate/cardiolipin synthase-like enzyme